MPVAGPTPAWAQARELARTSTRRESPGPMSRWRRHREHELDAYSKLASRNADVEQADVGQLSFRSRSASRPDVQDMSPFVAFGGQRVVQRGHAVRGDDGACRDVDERVDVMRRDDR